MRVLIVPFPWKTHLFNLVPLAWSLQTAGHEVRVAGWPDLLDAVTGAGLTGMGVGPGETAEERKARDQRRPTPAPTPAGGGPLQGGLGPLFDVRPDRERLSWEQVTKVFDNLVLPQARRSNDSMMEDLVAFALEWRPDLVLWGAKAFAGAVAAEAVGAVHARILYSVDVYTRMREDFLHAQALQPEEDRVDPLRDWLSGWVEKFGGEFSEDLVNGQFTIDPLPEAFRPDPRPTTLPMQFVPYNGPTVVPRWLTEPPRAPRVLMTFGDSVNDGPVQHLLPVERIQEILDSVGDLDMELVLTLPEESQRKLRDVPANTRLVESVPLSEILPTCAAMVHHGGTWSFGCALRYGVPQLLISRAFDVPLKLQCLDRTGAGLSMKPADVDGPGVRDAIVRLLEDEGIRANARRLRDDVLAMPAPNELARTLEVLVLAHRAGKR
ncbi:MULTISPECIES: activator-dependent family glycosyltransferase [unclassified Streptomyces]|uniref:activator-dependent family glycosyltransferase n=1 Tax=unclassified Streptomyces TaxID=2593676 RepID=UPI002256BD0F|nr:MULTISPECIES: activator-dependent family glycosyltransferase [unclassified Streptomyces]MCX4527166.1 activator-dependent family glycosyltransferase [Streptomyces sp. NBC_01551]MCX4542258.1 activator-dependent family glycosyltransferase [Streptomyces sp. NBC_01565]